MAAEVKKIPAELLWIPQELKVIKANALILITGYQSLAQEVERLAQETNRVRATNYLAVAKWYAVKGGLSEAQFVNLAKTTVATPPNTKRGG